MTTSLDTNVLLALWDKDPALNHLAQNALDSARASGPLVVCGAVYAELLAFPGHSENMLDAFFAATGIRLDWESTSQLWRLAGTAFQGYAVRRRTSRGGSPNRILADFLIGAHAAVHNYRLLTMDKRLYRAAFPNLTLSTF